MQVKNFDFYGEITDIFNLDLLRLGIKQTIMSEPDLYNAVSYSYLGLNSEDYLTAEIRKIPEIISGKVRLNSPVETFKN